MKKYSALIAVLVLVFALTLTSCSNTPSPGSSTAVPEGSEAAASKGEDETDAGTDVSSPSEKEEEDFVGALESVLGADGKTEMLKAADFSLRDQNGVRHRFSDYRGKVVVLNFWQTWCPPCRQEMPDLQDVYEQYGLNQEDVAILGVASPKNELMQDYTMETMTDSEIRRFLGAGGYTYPSLMDYTGKLYTEYFIQAFPTSYVIDREGYIVGRIPGAVTAAYLVEILNGVLEMPAE